MTNLTATPAWSDVPQHETTTQVLGGPGAPMNTQAQALLNRTEMLLRAPLPRPRIGLMGDSIMALTTNYASQRNASGAVSWMLARLGQPWYLPVANNFAVGGTTTDVMVSSQLPLVLASHASKPMSRVFISAGTNDPPAGNTLAQIKNNLTTIFDTLLSRGIIPVHHGILPRGADGADTNFKRMNRHLNEWMQWYAYTRGGLEFIDCGLDLADNSNASGNALAALTDGSQLHPLDPGGFLMGKRLADYYSARGIGKSIRFASTQADKYDATYNPTGVVFDNPNPLLQGGTTAPTDMTTSGGTWAVGTQTLPNGQTKPTVNCTLASDTTHYLYDDALATGAWDTENVREGDYVYAQCEIELINVVSLAAAELRLVENNGTSTVNASDLTQGSGSIGNVNSASLTLYTQTPPILIRPYGGSSNASLFVQQRILTGAGETGSVKIKSFEMRKWVGEV